MGKLTRTSTSISAKRLADFISQVQEHEALLLQRLRDLEGLMVLNALTEKPEQKAPGEIVTPRVSSSSKEVTGPCLGEEYLPPLELELVPIFEEYR